MRETRAVAAEPSVLLLLDLAGTFAFALNGALTAVRAASLDVVGVVTLGLITAVGGGIIRDVLLGDLPPATFVDWLIAFLFSRLSRYTNPIDVLDAAGLSLFAGCRPGSSGGGTAARRPRRPAEPVDRGADHGRGGYYR